MYQQFNEQFAAATRQFADTAAQVNRLALDNAEAVFGLQIAAIEDRVNATFAFFGEAAEARDFDALKSLFR
ncbi:phasin family protein [Streptomyces sp. NPDC006624]|uniref:phasin family protein n=1 Tax=Streptomyces sp. NPDC006624 TaxID=3154892 RepID=UPI0033A9DFC7